MPGTITASVSRAVGAALFLALTIAFIPAASGVADAAVITVTTTADGVAADGVCSLREAVIAANTDQATGGCPAGSGADVITFASSFSRPATFQLTTAGAGEDAASTGDLDIVGRLAINGDGADQIAVDGQSLDRVFEVRSGAAVELTGLTVRSGTAPSPAGGGGILVDSTGALTLTATAISGNTASMGGGLLVFGSLQANGSSISGNSGPGLAVDGGKATLRNVIIAGNTGGPGVLNRNQATLDYDAGEVRDNGGGIANQGGQATLVHLLIADNGGSGVTNTGSVYTSLTMSLSSVTGNRAAQGGGLNNSGVGAGASVTTSSFTGNSATGAGGGVYNNGVLGIRTSLLSGNHARTGGGIDHAGGDLHLENDTLSGNSAADNAGGLYNRSASIVTNVTFYSNTAGGPTTGPQIFNDTASMTLQNALVEGGAGNCTNSEGFLTSLGHNLETGNSCALTGPGDQVNVSSLLRPLKDNGGATRTHALKHGEPGDRRSGFGSMSNNRPARDHPSARSGVRHRGVRAEGRHRWRCAFLPPICVILTANFARRGGLRRPHQQISG